MWDWPARVLGVCVPVLFHVLAPDPLVGGEIVLWFITMGMVAGILLRSWWSPLIVASLTLAIWLIKAGITSGAVLAEDSDFTLVGAIVVVGGVLLLIGGSALIGSLLGWAVERQFRERT